jgi:hypothetical protein
MKIVGVILKNIKLKIYFNCKVAKNSKIEKIKKKIITCKLARLKMEISGSN